MAGEILSTLLRTETATSTGDFWTSSFSCSTTNTIFLQKAY